MGSSSLLTQWRLYPAGGFPAARLPQVKAFDEPAHSLALHPTGYLLLAGFADKLRLMTVLSGGPQ